jgi:hypothetical protein
MNCSLREEKEFADRLFEHVLFWHPVCSQVAGGGFGECFLTIEDASNGYRHEYRCCTCASQRPFFLCHRRRSSIFGCQLTLNTQ